MAAPETFTNPVHDGYFADPFILRHDGVYYAYGTNNARQSREAFEILRSTDLVHWSSIGRALPAVDGLDARDHWAPEVAFRDGQPDAVVADRPEGPFRYDGVVLTPSERFAIDASPFRDEDGQWYLFYARDVLEGARVGTSLAVDRLVSMDRLAGEPVPVLLPSADWQLFRRRRPIYGAVHDWHTLEGPFVVKRRGRYWCFYSGGAWTGAGYGVSFAVADSPLGPWAEPAAPGPTVLRSLDGELEGPGHTSVVVAPDGSDYIVYHAWDATRSGRRMCLDRLVWTDHGPRALGPTSAMQPVPVAS